jgi:hypothetical protein
MGCLSSLIEAYPDLKDAKNDQGKTPLEFAREYKYTEAEKILA